LSAAGGDKVQARAPFPWDEAMAFGLGRLRLSPHSFWAMTPRELAAGAEIVISILTNAEAIAAAISAAAPGDVVLLAGKGHERTIERGGVDEPWDEVAAAREALTSLGYPQGT
jgi:hypothetical protein